MASVWETLFLQTWFLLRTYPSTGNYNTTLLCNPPRWVKLHKAVSGESLKTNKRKTPSGFISRRVKMIPSMMALFIVKWISLRRPKTWWWTAQRSLTRQVLVICISIKSLVMKKCAAKQRYERPIIARCSLAWISKQKSVKLVSSLLI